MEWRKLGNWRWRSLLLVTCGSLLAGSFLIWQIRRRRRRLLPLTTPTRRQAQPSPATTLKRYSISHYRVDIADSVGRCEEILCSKTPQSLKIVGLDCEWKGEDRGGRYPVALLQLAFLDGHCLLVRLCKVEEIPPTLTKILEDGSILKFGVAIKTDVERLFSGFGVKVVGCVDLRHIAVRSGISYSGRGLGLHSLTALLLGAGLDKSWRLRCSDWEADTLSPKQVEYAASDAIVALDILQALIQTKMAKQSQRGAFASRLSIPYIGGMMSRTQSAPVISQDNKSLSQDPILREGEPLLGQEKFAVLLSLCKGIVDVGYKQPQRASLPISSHPNRRQSVQPKRTMAYSVRQTPLYHNCRLLAPDGALLSWVDRRKIDWYLERGLGDLISESPPTLQLNFEPTGRPGKDREYYLVEKQNICVVCGRGTDCVRKCIIPHEYRKFFPTELKEHLSHDILLLCVSCHQQACVHSDQLKRQLAEEYGAPLPSSRNLKFQDDPKLVQVKSHARALLKCSALPEDRREELLATVAGYWGCGSDDVTEEMIQKSSEIDTRSQNTSYSSHAEQVVKKIQEEREGGLERFQRLWREHFLATMKPKYLPDLWCVEHNLTQ